MNHEKYHFIKKKIDKCEELIQILVTELTDIKNEFQKLYNPKINLPLNNVTYPLTNINNEFWDDSYKSHGDQKNFLLQNVANY